MVRRMQRPGLGMWREGGGQGNWTGDNGVRERERKRERERERSGEEVELR